MRLSTLRRSREGSELPGVHGVARVDRVTAAAAGRMRRGDIAIIDHLDLDKVSAEELVRRGAAAVVNAAPSSSGRYPNLGPEILIRAGIPLLDAVGPEVLASVEDGDRVRLDGDRLYRRDAGVAVGIRQSASTVEAAMAAAHARLAKQLEAFAGNTVEYIRRDRELLLDGVGVPDLHTLLTKRPVVLVMSGAECKQDLRTLRRYIKESRPVLIGVGPGADALLDEGHRPDLVVGEPGFLSDAALHCGAEVVVHVHRDGGVRGLQRVQDSGAHHALFAAGGSSEDVAMLLADDKGADLIVTAGASASLIEFFDKGRTGMASTFVARLRVGGKLVDARAVRALHRSPAPMWPLWVLVIAAVTAVVVAVLLTPRDAAVYDLLQSQWSSLLEWLAGFRGLG